MNTVEAINLESIIESKNPEFFSRLPKILGRGILSLLKSVLHADEINRFIEGGKEKRGLEFIDEIFEYLDFAYMLTSKDLSKIPAEGKLIIVSNHPLGALDGLALLKAVSEVRRDVKIVVNDVLLKIENLKDLFLPFDIFSERTQRQNLIGIKNALMKEEAVIFFPSAEVSRLGINGVTDGKWQNGAVYFARKYEVPVLPVYVQARNSFFFYILSMINKNTSMFLLPHQLFRSRSTNIRLKIGDPIPGAVFKNETTGASTLTKLLRSHVYRIGKNRPGLLKTEKTIIHPVDKKTLKKEFADAQFLDAPAEGKRTYLVKYSNGKNILREIARLREITFRKVGEGTGGKMDTDRYDRYYSHIVLWDEEELEIIGAYRLGVCGDILERQNIDAFYTSALFRYRSRFKTMMPQAIELGRSFIQYNYWKSNALHYLWRGIGALIKQLSGVRYLFGAVSISNNYTEIAKSHIIYYYQKWFNPTEKHASARNAFTISTEQKNELDVLYSGEDSDADYKILKRVLKNYGFAVPVLFRQYTKLCAPQGVHFHDFCIDPGFKTVDGLVVIDITHLKAQKKKAYGVA